MMLEDGIALPPGWFFKTIGDVYEVVGGGTPSTAVEEYWVGDIPWITSADIYNLKDIRPRRKIAQEAIRNSATNQVPSGTIIVVTRVSLGKVALTSFPLCFSQDSQALLPKKNLVLSEFALYYLSQATQSFKQKSRGTTISGVTKKQLKDLPIPIPPLPEQERIVARIESLFTQMDAGVAALKRLQAALKRYRLSVLKAACEGRLVPQDPNDEPAEELMRRFGVKSLDCINMPGFPLSWGWTLVKDVGDIQLGRQRAPKYHEGPHMRPYLRVANVFEDRIDTSDILRMNFSPKEYDTYLLKYGDILLNEGQSPELLGRPAMYRNEIPGACFQNTLIRFRASEMTSPQFALIVFRHYMHSGRFAKESQITTNLAHLSAGRFSNIEFPLPPLPEQRRIVAEVERQLSVVQELEQTISANLKRAARLRQAILKRAFEGKLS